MDASRVAFLKQLLSTPGPSGDEAAAARVWRAEARAFADTVRADVAGNSFAVLEGQGPRVLLAGHIDEIGLMVTHVDEQGFLFFAAIGGWDAQVLVGQRVRLPRGGIATGVVSIPNRYMHSPNEMLDLGDVEHAARLIAAFVRGIGSVDEFVPE